MTLNANVSYLLLFIFAVFMQEHFFIQDKVMPKPKWCNLSVGKRLCGTGFNPTLQLWETLSDTAA